MVSEHVDQLEYNYKTITELDFIFAKKPSRQMKGSEPIFNNDGIIDLKIGQHPLIDPKQKILM